MVSRLWVFKCNLCRYSVGCGTTSGDPNKKLRCFVYDGRNAQAVEFDLWWGAVYKLNSVDPQLESDWFQNLRP